MWFVFLFKHGTIMRMEYKQHRINLGKEDLTFEEGCNRYIVLYTIDKSSVFVDKFLDSRKENKLTCDLLDWR